MPTPLSGEEIEFLARRLSTTLSESDLEMIVYTATGDRLFEAYVGDGLPLRRTIYDLLIELEKRGITDKLVREVYERRSNRPDIRGELAALFPAIAAPPAEGGAALDLQRGGAAQPDAPTMAAAPGLEKNVRPYLAMLDVRVWLDRLAAIERRVCRVERNDGALGTGFLVGPAAVVTNWHVVEAAAKDGRMAEIACRFDYLRLEDGARQPGVRVALAADGLAASAPYAPAEVTRTPDTPPPLADQLDYALLALAEPAGDRRGWVALPEEARLPARGAPILIVQHPDGAPMKLALDTEAVIGPNAEATRLRYRTNTEPGSSGSPCFSIDWAPVALHHLGDPAWANPTYNQGVPLHLVRASIAGKGKAALLGAAG